MHVHFPWLISNYINSNLFGPIAIPIPSRCPTIPRFDPPSAETVSASHDVRQPHSRTSNVEWTLDDDTEYDDDDDEENDDDGSGGDDDDGEDKNGDWQGSIPWPESWQHNRSVESGSKEGFLKQTLVLDRLKHDSSTKRQSTAAKWPAHTAWIVGHVRWWGLAQQLCIHLESFSNCTAQVASKSFQVGAIRWCHSANHSKWLNWLHCVVVVPRSPFQVRGTALQHATGYSSWLSASQSAEEPKTTEEAAGKE